MCLTTPRVNSISRKTNAVKRENTNYYYRTEKCREMSVSVLTSFEVPFELHIHQLREQEIVRRT